MAHLLVLEHAPRRAGRRVGVALLVDALLGVRRVEGHDDPVEPGQRLLRGPQVEPRPLDDTALLRIDQLAVQLLPADDRALVLLKLLEERVGQVRLVVERRSAHDDPLVLRRGQLADDVARLGRRGPQHLRRRAEAHAHHRHVPHVLRVHPRGQLVEPATAVLRPAQPLRLLGREAPDRADAAGDVLDLHDHVRLVVLDQQIGRQHGQDAALALEAGELDVAVRRRDHRAVEAAGVLIRCPRDPLSPDARLAEAAPGEDACLRPVRLGQQLARPRRGAPPALPVEVYLHVVRQTADERGEVGGAARHRLPARQGQRRGHQWRRWSSRYRSSAPRSCSFVTRILSYRSASRSQ